MNPLSLPSVAIRLFSLPSELRQESLLTPSKTVKELARWKNSQRLARCKHSAERRMPLTLENQGACRKDATAVWILQNERFGWTCSIRQNICTAGSGHRLSNNAPRNCLSTHHIQVLACLWSLNHANIMPFLSGQVTKLCCVRQQFCSKHPLCIKIIWCISVLFFMKSGIWAIPGEAVQSKTPQSCDQAGPIDCYWLLNWGRQQANGRSSRYRPGGSFKLKLEGLCLSFFYPKDKMPIIFNECPRWHLSGQSNHSKDCCSPKSRTESFRAASGVILPDICYLHHYNILTQTKLNTRIALVKQTLNWRALHQIIPLNFLNPEAEGWPHRAQCLKGKTRNRRYSLVHRISTNGTSGSPIRIPWVPSGDAPEVVACRWLQANQDGWSNLIHVAVLGPQERAVVVSIFSICGCGITIIYI